MSELVHTVAMAIGNEQSFIGGQLNAAARAAIAAVFDHLARPSKLALFHGDVDIAATCEECPSHTYGLGESAAEEVWQAMLSTMRREALGDQL